MPFTNANGPVHLLASQGTFARFSTEKPTMTFFRYNAQQCTSFGQCWFFENFDKGKSAYLGESLTYTASRNKDVHGDTLIAVDLPGIGNFQWITDKVKEVVADSTALKDRYDEITTTLAPTLESTCTAKDTGSPGTFLRLREGQPYYCDGVSMAMIKGVEYQLGGQRMDRHDKHTLYTWHLLNQVNVPHKMLGLAEHDEVELKSDSMRFQRKYCPLVFSFCRHPSMGIPLISNMYNNLIIQVDLEPFSALICNYSGAGVNAAGGTSTVLVAGADTYCTRKRAGETNIAASRTRVRDLGVNDAAITTTITTSDLAKEDFPVSVVSRVYFLGPQERYAFASNAHSQVVEACQRVKHSVTKQTEYTFRTDTLQNACSVLYVVPQYRPQLAANRHFDYGGAHDHARNCSLPALTTLQFTTNGADLYSEQDQSFYQQVQPFAHHKNSARGARKVYPMNFGIQANAMGPVQYRGAVNLSRSVNSQCKLGFASSMWDKVSGGIWAQAATDTTVLDIEFVVWNYNVLAYRGGIGGYKFTQSNNSL
jgi:hypothetical protein